MKKFIFILLILLLSCFFSIGYKNSIANKENSKNNITKINLTQAITDDSKINVSHKELIYSAYRFLTENENKNISSLDNVAVSEVKITEDLLVINSNETINIKNAETYKISFTEINPTKIGASVVFIDKKTLKVLGVGLGE